MESHDEQLPDSVDGVVVPPSDAPAATTPASVVAPKSSGAERGGSVAKMPSTGMEMVQAFEEDFVAAGGSKQTAGTYGWWARRFLLHLEEKGISFDKMTDGEAEAYLAKTVNPITHNVGVTALSAFFDSASKRGKQFAPQTMTRMKTKRKNNKSQQNQQVPGVPAGAVPMSAPLDNPFASPYVAPMQTQQVAAPVAAPPQMPAQVQPTQAPQQRPVQQSAFTSLGQRVRISKVASGGDGTVPPGMLITLGTYDKGMIEPYGTLENFIATCIRPVNGPKPGEPVVVYRVQNLDTSARPLPGQEWSIPILPDPLAPAPAQHGAQQVVVQAPLVNNMPQAIMEKMLGIAFDQQAQAQKRYDDLLTQLTAKKNAGEINDSTMLLLLQQNRPEPLDVDKLKRALKDELATLAPPPPPPTPMGMGMGGMMGGGFGGGLFDAPPPRADPALDRMSALIEKQTEMMNQLVMRQLTQQPPPQKDPMETAMAMVTAMNAMSNKPNPVMEQLAALTLKQFENPPKSKTLQEIIGDVQAIRQLTEPPERGDSFLDKMVDMIGVVAENGDKLGEMFARMKGGAIKAALTPPQQPRLPAQAPQAAAPAADAAQKPKQPVVLPAPVKAAVIALMEVYQTGNTSVENDANYAQAMVNLLEALNSAGTDAASGVSWTAVAERVVDLFKRANNKTDLQALILNLFQWLKVRVSDPAFTDHLTTVMHRNYTAIFGFIDGGQKVLDDADGAQPAPATGTAPAAPTATAAPAASAAPIASAEEDGDEEDEEEDAELAADPAA